MTEPSAIGPHQVWRRGDLLEIRFAGPFTYEQVMQLRELMLAVRRDHPGCYMLADASGLTGITAEARRAMSDWSRSNPVERLSGAGVYGVNFAMRTLIMLTVSAVRFMTRREVSLHFAADEAEALAWIAERRAAGGPAA